MYRVTEVLRALRGGLPGRGRDVVPPISVSVVYRFTGAGADPVREVKYGRENNPTTMILEEALRVAEEAEWCLAFNTGMAAITSLLSVLAAHGARRVIASRLLYGTTRGLLDELASLGLLEVRYAGPPWEELLDTVESLGPDVVLVETIGNPTLRVPPLRAVAEACEERGCALVVDNTFASPYLFQPLSLPGNVVAVESLTKYIGGHNDVLGGAVCGRDEELQRSLWDARRMTGSILQPLDAYLAARGLRTLHLRMEAVSRGAERVARGLAEKDVALKVYYPGLPSHPDHGYARELFPGLYGGVVSFDVGSGEAARRVLEGLRLVVPSPSLGGVESIMAYPYESSHRGLSEEEKQRLGITPGLLRLSVGLEDPDDVLEDVVRAVRAARSRSRVTGTE